MESSSQAAVLTPSPLSAPIISASHIGKVYGSGKLKVEALRDVTFDVQPGEFVAIVARPARENRRSSISSAA